AIADLDVPLGVGAPWPVRPEVGIVLFRVLEEAIATVRRRADTRRVAIEVAGGNGTLELRVRDDGRGFDPDTLPRGHFGLLYMRERVEACGGRLRVSSHPGSGTEVRATVPAGSEERIGDEDQRRARRRPHRGARGGALHARSRARHVDRR